MGRHSLSHVQLEGLDMRGHKSRMRSVYDVFLPNFGHMVSGFGYTLSTNEYKVVRIYYGPENDHNQKRHVQVYTLGSGTGWRNKEETIYWFQTSEGVSANEVIHWIEGEKIVAMGLADEKF